MADQTFRVAILQKSSSQDLVNVLHWRGDVGSVTEASMDDLASAIEEDWVSTVRQYQVSGLTYVGCQIRSVENPLVGKDYAFAVAGALTGDYGARQVSIVCALKSGLIGRRFNGRFYLGGISEAYITNGAVLSNVVTEMTAALTAKTEIQTSTGVPWALQVYSKKFGVSTPVNAVLVRDNPGIIRKRRLGVGS